MNAELYEHGNILFFEFYTVGPVYGHILYSGKIRFVWFISHLSITRLLIIRPAAGSVSDG